MTEPLPWNHTVNTRLHFFLFDSPQHVLTSEQQWQLQQRRTFADSVKKGECSSPVFIYSVTVGGQDADPVLLMENLFQAVFDTSVIPASMQAHIAAEFIIFVETQMRFLTGMREGAAAPFFADLDRSSFPLMLPHHKNHRWAGYYNRAPTARVLISECFRAEGEDAARAFATGAPIAADTVAVAECLRAALDPDVTRSWRAYHIVDGPAPADAQYLHGPWGVTAFADARKRRDVAPGRATAYAVAYWHDSDSQPALSPLSKNSCASGLWTPEEDVCARQFVSSGDVGRSRTDTCRVVDLLCDTY